MSSLPRRPIIATYQLFSGRRWLTRLDELNKTQWLSRTDLLDMQRNKLYRLLAYSYKNVPYYRNRWDEHRFRPNEVLSGLESFQRLPLLTKDIVRREFELLQTTEPDRRSRLTRLTTGGSTGRPLTFMEDSNYRDYVTADYHRHMGWAGWVLGDPHCYIWGAHFEHEKSKRLRSRLMDWSLNRFVANSFVLSDEVMAAFAADYFRYHPRLIFAYPSSVYRFAKYLQGRGINDISFDAIFTSAEMIHPYQRTLIEETLGGRVFNRYATREVAGISCECPAHLGMHTSVENVFVEILRGGCPALPGEDGDIVITNLNNYGMPLIRYSLEDIGAWSTIDECPCGRQAPMMDLHQGRRTDLFRTRDGREIRASIVSPLFAAREIKQFQLVQKSFDLIVIKIVKDGEPDPILLDQIEYELRGAYGCPVEIRYEFPDEIPVLESGKFRYVISEITADPVSAQ